MTPSRALSVFAACVRASFGRAAELRFDFLFRSAMDLTFYAVNIAFFEVLYRHVEDIGGWRASDVRVFLGTLFVVDALKMTLFERNCANLPGLINRGDLDYYLIRPVPTLFLVSLREIAASSFINLASAVALLAVAITRHEATFNAWKLAAFAVAIGAGTLLHYLVHLLCMLPSFWSPGKRGLEGVFYAGARFTERPDRLYRGFARVLLTTVLPFGVMVSFPARILLDEWRWSIMLHLCGLTALAAGVVSVAWRLGLRRYGTGAS